MIRASTWILVLSATRARILRGLPTNGAAPPGELVLRCSHRRLRDILANGHGRGARKAGQGAQGVMQDRQDFLGRVVDFVEAHRLAGDFASIAVVAEPELLAAFRALAPPNLAARLVAASADDLLHLPPVALAEALLQELAPSEGSDNA